MKFQVYLFFLSYHYIPLTHLLKENSDSVKDLEIELFAVSLKLVFANNAI